MKLNQNKIILLGIVLIFSIGLRLIQLTHLPVFADESIYIRWAQVMKSEPTLRFLPQSDGKQPLFMWLIIPFFKLFSDPLFAGRFVSVLSGLGTVLGLVAAAYLLFRNYKVAITAGLIWAVLPYSVFFERLALADALLTMFIVWTFVFSYAAFFYMRWDLSMLAGFSLGFAWLTKSPAIFSLALIPLLISHKNVFRNIGIYLTILIIGFSMYNILRLGPEFHQIAIRNKDYIHPLSEVLKHPLDPLISHLRDTFDFTIRFLTPIGVLLWLLGVVVSGKNHIRSKLILVAWFLGPIIVQAFIAKTFTARYLFFTIPFSVIMIAHGIWHFGDRTKNHILSFLMTILLVVTCLIFDYLIIAQPELAPLPRIERSGYLEEWTAGQGIKQAASKIIELSGDKPVVVGSEGFFGTPFSALEMYFNQNKNIRIVGLGSKIGLPDPKIVSASADNLVFIVANSTRLNDDPEKLGYTVINSYPKADRPDGTREFLLLMKIR